MFNLAVRTKYILLGLAAIVTFLGGFKYADLVLREREAGTPPVVIQPGGDQAEGKNILVHVAGAVKYPGVYELPPGSRVRDAVEKAQPNNDADVNLLNLAAVVTDGQKIVVPRQGETVSQPGPGSPGSSPLVNINTATLEELDRLPGIGPALAQRIIRYRETNGRFRVPEDIKNVSGIGEAKFEQLKDLITVD